MVRTTCSSNGRKYKKYVCSTSKRYGSKLCSSHIIDEDVLLEIILHSIQLQIKCAVNIEKTIKQAQKSKVVKQTTIFLEKKSLKIENEIHRITTLKQGLYEDCKSGLITKQEYYDMKTAYEDADKDLNLELVNINKQIQEVSTQGIENNMFITTFKKYGNITEITREVIVALIDEIVVHEGRRINIKFKFEDEYKKLEVSVKIGTESKE
jgi:hypothetical protein